MPSSAGPARAGADVKVPTADTVWTQRRLGRARRRPSGDADLRQRRGARIPPHHRGRRQVSVHDQGRGGEQEREPGHALSLCADLAPRHADNARLLHPARRPDRHARRQGCRKSPTADHRGQERRSPSTSPMAGSASPTNTGPPCCCPRHDAHAEGAILRPALLGTTKTYQTDYLLDAQTIAPGATGSADARLFAGAKEVARRQRLREDAQAQPFRSADRLGLVLLHHQAAVLR